MSALVQASVLQSPKPYNGMKAKPASASLGSPSSQALLVSAAWLRGFMLKRWGSRVAGLRDFCSGLGLQSFKSLESQDL